MRENIFKWNNRIPVELMRIEPLGKLYAYSRHDDQQMVFKVVPNGGYRGSGAMLRAYRVKHNQTQAQARMILGVSQPAIARYEEGKRTMPLRVALAIQRLNAGTTVENSWHKKHRREKIFKLTKGTHIAQMRVEALGKLYAYDYHKDDEMVFRVVPKVKDQDSGKPLKALRVKRAWTQTEAGKNLGVSQSMIAKYETGERIMPRQVAVKVRLLNNGLTLAEVEQYELLQKRQQDAREKIVT